MWEKTYLERAVSLANSGADSWDLPKTGFLSSLIINLHAKNDSAHNRNNQIWEHLDKIEVLHRGTEVIKSLKYCEPHALNVYDTGRMPEARRREPADHYVWETFALNFGRYPGDLVYGLDLSKLVDPKFHLEWNLDLSTDGTADQFETGSLVLNIIALALREGPVAPLKGYIKSSEIDAWTGSHDVEHTVEMPIGHDYRRIMLRSYLKNYELFYGAWYTELDLNRGTRIPFKQYGKEWLYLDPLLSEYKALTQTMYGRIGGTYGATSCAPNTNLGSIEGFSVVPASPDRTTCSCTVSGSVAAWQVYDTAGNVQTAAETWAIFTGIGPFNCLVIPFDKPDMDFNLKSRDYTDIDLKVTSHYEFLSAEAAQDIRVVLEEVIVP